MTWSPDIELTAASSVKVSVVEEVVSDLDKMRDMTVLKVELWCWVKEHVTSSCGVNPSWIDVGVAIIMTSLVELMCVAKDRPGGMMKKTSMNLTCWH